MANPETPTDDVLLQVKKLLEWTLLNVNMLAEDQARFIKVIRLLGSTPLPQGEEVNDQMALPMPANISPEDMTSADDFGDVESLFNSRNWLEKALTKAGASIEGGGVGGEQADLDVSLEGHGFNVSIRPRMRTQGEEGE